MEAVARKLKSVIAKLGHVQDPSHDCSLENLPSEDELLFEEMDLIIREEINRLEQALTDYLKAQLAGPVNSDIEDRYVTRITELYEKWAFLEPSNVGTVTVSSLDESDLEEKQRELRKRRTILENKIARRIAEWKKVPPKKAVIQFEKGMLIGNGFRKGTVRTFKYTLIVVHQR